MSANDTDTTVLIGRYERYIRVGLQNDEFYDLEAELALFVRDALEDRWHELDEEQESRVLALDEELVRHHKRVAVALADWKFDQPRERWWWYLDEGPQVRDTASKHTA